jgi:hypothetical protein
MAEEACAAPRAFMSPGIAIDASKPINATTNNMSISVKPASLRRFLRGISFISLSTYPPGSDLLDPGQFSAALPLFDRP